MKEKFEWDAARVVRLTRFATLAVGAVFLLAAIGFGSVSALAASAAKSEETRAKDLSNEAREIQEVLKEARSRAAVRVRTQSRAVADFQENVSNLAKENGVEVSEFLASTDFQPFLTRFSKKNDGEGWSQVEIQVVLVGDGKRVVELIRSLSEQSVPFEFNSLLIARESILASGTKVRAKMQLRVLVQAEGGSA
ncbi:MAG TPA: hypothetical protein PLX06_14100 [Fimbriimonadaceae bacterium]|nr:hypothetical protein [Fimbriimonadaceae bacterium]